MIKNKKILNITIIKYLNNIYLPSAILIPIDKHVGNAGGIVTVIKSKNLFKK